MYRLLAICVFAGSVSAQSPQATIAGVIRDVQGAVISDATITAINPATSQTSTVKSNATGFYSLPNLPIGAYTISVELPGFRRFVREGLTLTTGQALELDVTLQLGQVTESVTVSGQASLLETRTSDFNQLVESKTVEDIPLGDRRMMQVIRVTGAAVFVNYDSGGKPNFSLAGGRTQSQNFFVDGGTAQNMRLGIGQVDTDPPVENVQEVKVLANNYSAEYGGSAGGVIIATTKSGTNQVRGSLYEYFRNEKLDAGNYFSPIVNGQKQRAPLRYNIFGGTIGGPVWIPKLYNGKNKTFFFFTYEGSRRRDGFTDTFNVPTDLQKAGDFSQTLNAQGAVIPVYDPATTRTEGTRTLRDQFPGNRIPASQIDQVGRTIAALYPAPNRAPDNLTGANNYRANYVQGLTRDYFFVKLDHSLSEKDRITTRYMYNSDNLFFTAPIPFKAADTRNDADRHQHFFYGQWSRVFTPALVNEFRFTYGNRINWAKSPGLGEDWAQQLGIRGLTPGAFPGFGVTGFRMLGTANQERRQFPIQQFQFVNNLSWIRGRHSFKFGAEVRPSFNYETNRPTASGSFTFSPLATGLPGNAATGNGLASVLVGFPNAFATRETEVLDRRSWYLAAFAQDEWNAHRDLTVNIGMRWETDTPIVDLNNRMNGFDLDRINPVSGTPGVVRFMGVNGFRTNPYGTDWLNFGPRFGIAWKPFGSTKTVIRTGYGIFFAHPFDAGAPASASLGFELSANLNSPDNGITAPFLLRNGVPALSLTKPALDDSFGAVRVGVNPSTAVTFYEEGRRTGYSQQFNFGVQREVRGTLFEISFIGNLSRKLPSSNLGINQVRPERLTATSTQRDRPYPQFTNVTIQLPTLGVTNYYATVVRAERRFSAGFNLLSTYTFSKNLNNTNEGGSILGDEVSTYSNLYDREADYGPSENDIKHRFTFSSVYELPFGTGRKYLNTNALKYVLGGWGLGGILTAQTGPPFTVTTQVNTVYSAAGSLRADVLRNPALESPTNARWFDTEAFQQPAAAKFGNQGIGLLRSDGLFSLDLSVLRNFSLSEKRKMQLRAEFFNLTNTPTFGLPGHALGGPGFGIVSSAHPARRVQVGVRFVY